MRGVTGPSSSRRPPWRLAAGGCPGRRCGFLWGEPRIPARRPRAGPPPPHPFGEQDPAHLAPTHDDALGACRRGEGVQRPVRRAALSRRRERADQGHDPAALGLGQPRSPPRARAIPQPVHPLGIPTGAAVRAPSAGDTPAARRSGPWSGLPSWPRPSAPAGSSPPPARVEHPPVSAPCVPPPHPAAAARPASWAEPTPPQPTQQDQRSKYMIFEERSTKTGGPECDPCDLPLVAWRP